MFSWIALLFVERMAVSANAIVIEKDYCLSRLQVGKISERTRCRSRECCSS